MSDIALDCLVFAATMYALLLALIYSATRTKTQVPQDLETFKIVETPADPNLIRDLRAGAGICLAEGCGMTIWIADHDDAPTLVTEKTEINRQLKDAFGCPCQEKHNEA